MALDLVAELAGLVGGFTSGGVEYAVCGGLAVAIHGHPRATMDLDLLILPEQLAEALLIARQAGFDIPARKMIFGAATPHARHVQRVSKLEDASGDLLPLDLLLVGPVYREVWASRMVVRWEARDLSIVSRAGLLAMKRLAGRPQDLADIAALEAPDDVDK